MLRPFTVCRSIPCLSRDIAGDTRRSFAATFDRAAGHGNRFLLIRAVTHARHSGLPRSRGRRILLETKRESAMVDPTHGPSGLRLVEEVITHDQERALIALIEAGGLVYPP